jgi:prepilin signal peptidase PulO-like enzyme (type II secretory pathway)
LDAAALAEAGVAGIYAEPDDDWLPWLARPAVAAVTGALALAAGIAAGISGATQGPVTAAASALLAAVLVVLSAIDLKTMLLPDVIVLPLLGLIPVAGILGAAGGEFSWARAGIALACGIACFAFMWLVTFLTGGFGDGDAKLIPVLGFVLGLYGPGAAALGALILPMGLGAFVALPLMLAGKGGRTPIPFGPCLAAGTIFILVFPGIAAAWAPWIH